MTSSEAAAPNAVLDKLVERLFSALARGPAINCAPHNSRQRVDLETFARLDAACSGTRILGELLGPDKRFEIRLEQEIEQQPPSTEIVLEALAGPAATPTPKRPPESDSKRLLRKLATIASDADLYYKDTGSYVLHIGYPLLSIPGAAGRFGRGPSRILAPLALTSIAMQVPRSLPGKIRIACAEAGADRVVANAALKMWVERSLGEAFPELFEDEEGEDPFREISELTEHVAQALRIEDAPALDGWPVQRVPEISALPPRAAILPCAVLGLFQLRNQSTIRDMEELRAAEQPPEIVKPFVTLDASLIPNPDAEHAPEGRLDAAGIVDPHDEHLVDRADPCQRRAVLRARTSHGLVVHGPPGTGKSQTITNIVGDYLARGKTVLLVCEKMTALDVVHHRLKAIGLGDLCAVVHDAQRDRVPLYKAMREDLENLSSRPSPKDVATELNRVNDELARIQESLRNTFDALTQSDPSSGRTLQELVGQWIVLGAHKIEGEGASALHPAELEAREGEIRALYRRMESARLGENGWESNCGLSLQEFLGRDADALRETLRHAHETLGDIALPTLEGLSAWREDASLTEQTRTLPQLAASLREIEQAVRPPRARCLRTAWRSQARRAHRRAAGRRTARGVDGRRAARSGAASLLVAFAAGSRERSRRAGRARRIPRQVPRVLRDLPAGGSTARGGGAPSLWPEPQRRKRRTRSRIPSTRAGAPGRARVLRPALSRHRRRLGT